MGAYVQLLEYNNIEGMILLSELSRRRIRSINRLIRVGRNEVAMVIRVDKGKGYIDLSKRRVSAEEVLKAEERFNKSKAVHSIVKNVSNKLKVPMLSLYQRMAWPLYKRFPHAYDAFQSAVADPETVFKGLELTEEERHCVVEYICERMKPQPLKIRADVQVTCFAYEGIEAVREALVRDGQRGTRGPRWDGRRARTYTGGTGRTQMIHLPTSLPTFLSLPSLLCSWRARRCRPR